MAFEIEVDDKTAPDYSVDDNIAENLVDVIRSEMVGFLIDGRKEPLLCM